jgi:hypothetical protein
MIAASLEYNVIRKVKYLWPVCNGCTVAIAPQLDAAGDGRHGRRQFLSLQPKSARGRRMCSSEQVQVRNVYPKLVATVSMTS